MKAFDNYYVFCGESKYIGHMCGMPRYDSKFLGDIEFENMPSKKRLKNIGGNLFYFIKDTTDD